jgi:predicted DNA-binding transcriptional regulator AlpA
MHYPQGCNGTPRSLHGQAADIFSDPPNSLIVSRRAAHFYARRQIIKETAMSAIKLLKTPEAAEILGLSPITLEIWRIQGKGPKFRKIGRLVRYAESDIHAYITAATRSNTSQTPEQANA